MIDYFPICSGATIYTYSWEIYRKTDYLIGGCNAHEEFLTVGIHIWNRMNKYEHNIQTIIHKEFSVVPSSNQTWLAEKSRRLFPLKAPWLVRGSLSLPCLNTEGYVFLGELSHMVLFEHRIPWNFMLLASLQTLQHIFFFGIWGMPHFQTNLKGHIKLAVS